jgi:hypothetical protein
MFIVGLLLPLVIAPSLALPSSHVLDTTLQLEYVDHEVGISLENVPEDEVMTGVEEGMIHFVLNHSGFGFFSLVLYTSCSHH